MLPDTFRSRGGAQNCQSVPTDVDDVLHIESIFDLVDILSAHTYMRLCVGWKGKKSTLELNFFFSIYMGNNDA